jgi:hypothetical protein
MGLGETIGFSARLSEEGDYGFVESPGLYQVHVALMGDPTLRMHPVVPPSALTVATNGFGGVVLNWTASPDTVLGYHVYRAATGAGPFTRLNADVVTGTSYADPLVSSNVYMVRAVKLEVSASGSYYNASQGIFQDLSNSFGRSVLTITRLGDGTLAVRGNGVPGSTYRLQFATGTQTPDWQVLGSATADSFGLFQLTDTNGAALRLYRSIYP